MAQMQAELRRLDEQAGNERRRLRELERAVARLEQAVLELAADLKAASETREAAQTTEGTGSFA